MHNGGFEKHFLHCSAGSGDVVLPLMGDVGEGSSLLVSKRGEAERLTELPGCCLRQSGVAGVEFRFLCDFPTFSPPGISS